jgi:glycosyltransferase involved in cell wall biosynthesis
VRFTRRTGTARSKVVRYRVAQAPARRPGVTVVVPAYNYARYLPDAARSVLGQRDVDVRLIIADDASTDDTPIVTEALAAADRRLTVLRNPGNRGHVPTVNAALNLVETEYVVKLDADDLLAPGALARATALMETFSDVGFVYGRPRHFEGPVPEVPDSSARSWTIWPGVEWIDARCRSGANVISQPEVVMRTALACQVGWFCEDLPHASDMGLWLKLAAVGHVGRINRPAQGLYRVHDASMQRTVHAGVMMDLRGRRGAFDLALTRYAEKLPDADTWLRIARRSLAVTALDYACRAYDRGRTGEKPVDDLVAFALDTCPDTRDLKEWKALERRRAVGPERAPRHPQFFADAVTRRISEQLGHWNWLRTGEL